jgi:hypothetical protein
MEYHMLLKETQHYVHLFRLVSVGYLMTLSMSRKYTVQDITVLMDMEHMAV